MTKTPFFLLLLLTTLFSSSSSNSRHLLHQPFFPITTTAPPPSSSTQPPSPSPHSHHHHKKHPSTPQQQPPHVSSLKTPPSQPRPNSFFPSPNPITHQPPPPPTLITFPANISSLLFPQHTKPKPHHITKLITITASVISATSLLSLFLVFIIFLRRTHRHRQRHVDTKSTRSDSLQLFNGAPSDKQPPPKYTSSHTSSEFLYLGTLVNSRSTTGLDNNNKSPVNVTGVLELPPSTSYSEYHKLGSPELRPLPPLPKLQALTRSQEQLNTRKHEFDVDEDEFYSPRGSSGRRNSFMKESDIVLSSSNGSPIMSLRLSSVSPRSSRPVPTRPPPPPPPKMRVVEVTGSTSGGCDEERKPKLKGLHWDKVRASSSRVMVWDEIKGNSFQLNEEMMETLFRVNDPSSGTRDVGNVGHVVQSMNQQETRFLDPRKAHNIAILLRAHNVTVDEVCEALSEGNSDMVGPELLECLLKMAPTKEEEDKLKEFNDDDGESPSKLGPAEKFLKALLNIPFTFKRIDAMLYIVNFESETEYLKRSFDTLEAACGELKNTRMFVKLLEAVLKTGNRMNIGTNRGDAHAFKLDTLLKLVDIKGADGKTTLLHFVVQEIIKSEGARVSSSPTQSPEFQDDLELKKLGLQVVSGLSSQLINVKKAAAMDSNSLVNETTKVASGITKVREVIAELNKETGAERFLNSMNMFLNKGEKEITMVQSHGNNVMKMVKEVTEYFHGNSETHTFRIFAVVRDFLTILDQVCKEVGRVNERTVYGSVPRPSPSNQTVTPLFPVVDNNNNARSSHSGSLDDDDDGSV